MEDNSLHGDPKKPQDGACDMGLVSQLENQIVNGTAIGTGLGPEGLPLGMPTDLLALTSPFADQYASTLTPGALDQSPGCGSDDGKSKSRLVLDPHCSFLAGMSQESEAAWTLSGHAASRLFLNETASRAEMVAGMDGEAVCAQPIFGVGLDNDHFKAAGNLLIHQNILPVSPSLFNIPVQVSDQSVTLPVVSDT
jgi:hypothetical protein